MLETGPMTALAGQTALVTGATGGIGGATARALAEAGARVGVVARQEERLDALARELGGWSLPCDVTDAAAVAGLPDGFEARAGGPPDILVASAGVFSIGPIDEMSVGELDRNLAVNLRGSVLTVRAFLPGLKSARGGTIIQVGSVAGRKAFRGNGAYSASKFGLRGFHDVLLQEIRATGVRATLLEPAATDTSLWDPLEPDQRADLPNRASMLDAESVARCVVFVATRNSGVQIPYLAIEAI